MKTFPLYRQLDSTDGGATCLKMLTKFYQKNILIDTIRDRFSVNKEGISLNRISDVAETFHMHTQVAKMSIDQLKKEAHIPCILSWNESNFVVLYKIKGSKFYIADPGHGLIKLSQKEFLDSWLSAGEKEEQKGMVMFASPTSRFYELEEVEEKKRGLKDYLFYLKPYKKYYINVLGSLLLATLITTTMPFLTQALVDVGVNNRDLDFIYIILFAQITLFLSHKAGEVVRSWLLLHMTTRINIAIISDFLIKLMKLPISYFDKKSEGDIMQRLNDHQKIQQFFTASSLDFVFTVASILVFGSILAFYNINVCLIYFAGSILYFLWIYMFMQRRKVLDYKYFEQAVVNHNYTLELINGMQEIKLQNCEKQKRWDWEHIQVKNFKLGISQTIIQQAETVGSTTINEVKNIILTFYAATLVIEGEMTIGMMLAISYIIGQLNWIIPSLIHFMHSTQAAKLSIERLDEVHNTPDEEQPDMIADNLDQPRDLVLQNMSFSYGGEWAPNIFEWLHLTIPQGKVTAIVGASGSGKTTLLKLLLKNYEPTTGEIKYGETNLKNVSHKAWRKKFACVMAESFVFPDTVANNIAVGTGTVDKDRLLRAAESACIKEFIEGMPKGFNTKIGAGGMGLSQGQKQRLLLARAMYKDSDILLLDEATNALDANNERKIIENLNNYVQGKTVVVVAHRLSTVRDADQIIVLDHGKIVEQGSHEQLVANNGPYLHLIKNQLELGQ